MKLITKYLLFLSIATTTTGLAQKQNSHWFFGDHTGINFSSGAPVGINYGNCSTGEGAGSSISDINGNLLFYTDGDSVWDKNGNEVKG